MNMNTKEIESKARDLVEKLTLEEKASLCSGRDDWSTQSIERLGIPWIWVADGPHGLRRAPATNKPGYGDQLPATCFPTASALAATWDKKLIFDVGKALGEECQALGVHVLLGPGVNIKRSVLGGRNFEYFSEDPILAGEMGAAFIEGVQSQGVGTSLKHYVANNVETMRMYMNSDVDTRTLNEIYMTPFEIAVKKAQPWTVMACYNRVQGNYGTQNFYNLNDKLYGEWGYEGIVISDWFAIVDRVEALKARMHIEMPHVSQVNDELIVKAVKDGRLEERLLNDRVEEILQFVLKAHALKKEHVDQKISEHHQFARLVSAEAATLLKNKNDLLPITRQKYKKIALIGEFASNPRYQGNGSSEVKPTQLDNALEIIKKEFSQGFEVAYAPGYKLSDDNDYSMIEEAKRLAKDCDIAVLFVGLPLSYESEGIDRTHISLPESHNRLIGEIASVNPKTVVVLSNGSAVAMPWVDEVDSILETWLGGQAGAGGTADVLFGKVNPSGKLAETFPQKLEDTPSFLNFPGEQGEVVYGERVFVGYRYYDIRKIEPLYPFGHGLSYTTFEYSDMRVSSDDFSDKEGLKVRVKIKNTGKVRGKETVQLYVKDTKSTLQRPLKELKGFEKVALEPGEEKEVHFELTQRDFSYYDGRREIWIAESGDFEIIAASSSRDLRLTSKVTLRSTQVVPLMFNEYTFFSEFWSHEETKKLLIELMPKWISGWVPKGKSLEEAQVMDFFADHPIIKFPYITNGEITEKQVKDLIEKTKGLSFTP